MSQYDLSIFFAKGGESAFGLNNAAVTGVGKVAQTFLFLLLADDAAVGSTFFSEISGNVKTRDDEVISIFALAEYRIRAYLLAAEAALADDERYSYAELVSWEANNGIATFNIRVVNVSGDAIVVGTPTLEL